MQPLSSSIAAMMLEPAFDVARSAGVHDDAVAYAAQVLKGRRLLDPAVLALIDRLELGVEDRAEILRALLDNTLHTLEAIETARLVEPGPDGCAQLVAAQRELKQEKEKKATREEQLRQQARREEDARRLREVEEARQAEAARQLKLEER
eukprot:1935346-Pleurochrysis_carterae.AAC.1